MKKYLFPFLVIGYTALHGCAAPGSAIGRISIDGEIKPHPKEELRVRVTLDKDYGLSGLDGYFGKPEHYGHQDKTNILSVDENGIFNGPEAQVVYHITFWILPPLGGYPRVPPKPYFFLEFSNKKNEMYLVGESENGFSYKVFDIPTRMEISKDNAYWAIKSGKFLSIGSEGSKGWRLKLKIEEYHKTHQPPAESGG